MSKKIIVISFVFLQFLLAACQGNQVIVESQTVATSGDQISCVSPVSPEEITICDQMEAQILETTVRIEMEGFVTFGG